jgi:NTP pyrophosphatase (non-canonical NTP hydrolase)
MRKLQEYTKHYQKELNYHIQGHTYEQQKSSILLNYMLLTTEVAEIGELLREIFQVTESLIEQGESEENAFNMAKEKIVEEMGKEISDCIAYLCKFGNYFNRDMEEDFYQKMDEVKNRVKA